MKDIITSVGVAIALQTSPVLASENSIEKNRTGNVSLHIQEHVNGVLSPSDVKIQSQWRENQKKLIHSALEILPGNLEYLRQNNMRVVGHRVTEIDKNGISIYVGFYDDKATPGTKVGVILAIPFGK